ncbi:MAG: glycosyltransferase family 9 protein [candidate division KSB1 bacterium]|nr:glycosyltransferase family 9 protein [candidate division KSB1 bacterium]MDZ7338509.1 glycosyltransferase family 9 protein [candidate division KSB1 bacterium]
MTSTYRADCRHFRGDVPCAPHKAHQVHCPSCSWYEPTHGRILIIKLGAVGDVIRSTPILHPLRRDYPHAAIHWLTHTPEVVPAVVHRIHRWRLEDILYLQATEFELVINLDKDQEACALASMLRAKHKRGFLLKNGVPAPADAAAEQKFLTGLFDDLAKANTKSYPQELFEICGYTFAGEPYILDNFAKDGYRWDIPQPRPLVGLNTGCGTRWKSRLWPEEYWARLATALRDRGIGVVLLGGPQEHEKNQRLAQATGAGYLGHFPLRQFINLVDQVDLVVTAVTMALHVAIGLGKRIVLFNNTFNRHEFELYGLGEILEPDFTCDCFYAEECPNNCMQYLLPEVVLNSCLRQLQNVRTGGDHGA